VSAQLPLFTDEVGTWPYPAPCPVREDCGAYRCETGGCSGERAICVKAQLACGRWLPQWRIDLMSRYERTMLLGDEKSKRRMLRAIERSYET